MSVSGRKADASEVLPPKPIVHTFKLDTNATSSFILLPTITCERKNTHMEYTTKALAKLAGISPRTLRYYDEIGLLSPRRISNGYRIYGQRELDTLQQILFFRTLGLSLDRIGVVMRSPDFHDETTLEQHLCQLREKRKNLDRLIKNVEKTIQVRKGEITMNDYEKFEGFKQNLVDENDRNYGEEIRKKYGDDTVVNSYKKIKSMSPEQYADLQKLTKELEATLKTAVISNDANGDLAKKAYHIHKEWISYYWTEYSAEMHKNVSQMYVDDPRFTAYYEKIAPGSAIFLRNAIHAYCGE